MLTKGTEHDEWKGIANDPFPDRSEYHQKTAEEEEDPSRHVSMQVCANPPMARGLPVDAAPLPPAPRHPIRSQDNGVKLRMKPASALSDSQT